MKESPRVVDTKKDDLFEGIKEEEHKVDSCRTEASPPKDNDEKTEEKREISKSPIEIKESNPSVNESSEEVKNKNKEKKVEREESKVSDFKEDYEEIAEEEKPEENSDNEIKDDFEEMSKNGRVTHKRKSVLENQIFHDNVDACEISDDELD